jgi:plasmid segregation protein ParM
MISYNDLEIIGIDVGNANIKTANFTFPTGLSRSKSDWGLEGDYIYCDGYFYQPSDERHSKTEDKASSEFLPSLLLAIGKELGRAGLSGRREAVLALGLPPGSMVWESSHEKNRRNQELIQSLKNFYKNTFSFRFNKSTFTVEIKEVFVSPQGFSALYAPENLTENMRSESPDAKTPLDVLTQLPSAVLLDFGGVTVDAVPLQFGKIVASKLVSFRWGMFKFYSDVKTEAEKSQITLTDSMINLVLSGKKVWLPKFVTDMIPAARERYLSDLSGKLTASGLPFDGSYIILMGGGAAEIRPEIENRDEFRAAFIDIIPDSRANALGFEACAHRKLMNNGI